MNHKSLKLCAIVFAMIVIFGCRGGNKVVVDDEAVVEDEVVVDNQVVAPDPSIIEKWIDPADIGEPYPPIGEIKSGDIVRFAGGWEHKVGFIVNRSPDPRSFVEGEIDGSLEAYLKKQTFPTDVDYIAKDGWGQTYIRTFRLEEKLRPDGKWEWFFDWRKDWGNFSAARTVVPGSQPFVMLSEWDDRSDDINLAVGLDRMLDYKLLIYLEMQTQNVEGEVRRERVFRLILENARRLNLVRENTPTHELTLIRIGDKGKYVRASVNILPHTEMEKIHLPVSIDIGDRNIVIPAGHTFRSYRILSPSYMMYEASEENW